MLDPGLIPHRLPAPKDVSWCSDEEVFQPCGLDCSGSGRLDAYSRLPKTRLPSSNLWFDDS